MPLWLTRRVEEKSQKLTLTRGTTYVEQGVKKYEEQLRQKEKAVLKKLAKKHNMQIIEKEHAA